MPRRLKDCLKLLVAGLCLSTAVHAAHGISEDFTLLSRSTVKPLDVQLDPTQRQWIAGRHELVLGTSAPDYPPFDLTISGKDYEGFTADYAGILGKTLGLPVRVQRFASRGAAIKALKKGEVDLLGTANGFEAHNADIVLSAPYAVDQPVLLHGHCHQKAFDAVSPILEVLRWIPGAQPQLIESSCCGMAGSFGYEAAHHGVSMQMAELSLLPAVRAQPDAIVVADGTSCRHQIHDGAQREAVHLSQLLAGLLPG